MELEKTTDDSWLADYHPNPSVSLAIMQGFNSSDDFLDDSSIDKNLLECSLSLLSGPAESKHLTTEESERVLQFARTQQCVKYQDILAIYRFGSYNYGTHHSASDRDYMVIATGLSPCATTTTTQQYRQATSESKDINLTFYTPDEFQKRLDNHFICTIEALAHPVYCCCGTATSPTFTFTLDKDKLRSSISHIVSHSWLKARKKLVHSKDAYVAKKNVFHAFRILHCGIELCETGGIADWKQWKPLYDEVMNKLRDSDDWSHWESVYKQPLHDLHTRFRALAPKKGKEGKQRRNPSEET